MGNQSEVMTLTPAQKLVLDILQEELPLCERPFQAVGEKAGISEGETLDILRELMSQGIVRRMAGFFNPRAIGYVSTLCAAQVPEERLDEVARIINSYGCVTHNYLRANPVYNLWFTVIAFGKGGLGKMVRSIAARTHLDIADFRGTHFFKIKVRFPLEETASSDKTAAPILMKAPTELLTPVDKRLIHLLCMGVPLTERPFLELSKQLENMDEAQVLECIRGFKDCGRMRRLGIALKHTKVGYGENCMVVWNVPLERIPKTGQRMAADPAVSHCYCRVTTPQWRHNLYTMIHGKTPQDIFAAIERIRTSTGIDDYVVLRTLQELKKTGMVYFD